MKRIKLTCAVLLILLLAFTHIAYGASPYGSSTPDYGRSCSIDVVLKTPDGKPLPGGRLVLYSVAKLRDDGGSPAFFYTGDFGSGRVSDDDLSDLAGFADRLAKSADPASSSATERSIGGTGRVSFSGLSTGLYLLTQPRSAAGYQELLPAVIMLPQSTGGTLTYSVDVQSKPSTKVETILVDPPIGKRIDPDGKTGPMEDTLFTFKMTPDKPDYPMPFVTDPTDGSATLTRMGAGEVEFGFIEFGPDSVGKTYRYTLWEVPGDNKDYDYDLNQIYVVITIGLEEDGHLKYERLMYDKYNIPMEEATFVNIFHSPKEEPPTGSGIDDPTTGGGIGGGGSGDDSGSIGDDEDIDDNDVPLANLPQTGQLWWPVYLLSALGAVFFLCGFTLRKSSGDESF
jgi:hypothetical protein